MDTISWLIQVRVYREFLTEYKILFLLWLAMAKSAAMTVQSSECFGLSTKYVTFSSLRMKCSHNYRLFFSNLLQRKASSDSSTLLQRNLPLLAWIEVHWSEFISAKEASLLLICAGFQQVTSGWLSLQAITPVSLTFNKGFSYWN